MSLTFKFAKSTTFLSFFIHAKKSLPFSLCAISWTCCSASSAVNVHFFQKSFPRTTTTTNKQAVPKTASAKPRGEKTTWLYIFQYILERGTENDLLLSKSLRCHFQSLWELQNRINSSIKLCKANLLFTSLTEKWPISYK